MASNNTPDINPLADPNKWKLLADLDSNTLASIQWFKYLHNRVLYCTHDDRLFARGENNHGQLGIGHTDDVDTPSLVYGLIGQPVEDIVGSENITLARTQLGRVYAWGRNDDKELEGIPEDCITRPKHIESLKDIASIACGQAHSMALDEHGKMFIWGWNGNGQIGKYNCDTQSKPTQLDMFNAEVITQIECGAWSSMVLLDNGDVWVWGCLFGQNHLTPGKLNVSNHKVIQIACSRNVLVSLTQQGQIFIHLEDVTTPHLIQPPDTQFTSVLIVDCEKFDSNQVCDLVLANSASQKVYHSSGGEVVVNLSRNYKLNQWTESELSLPDVIVQYSTIQVSPFKMTLTHSDLSKKDCDYGEPHQSNENDNHATSLTKAIADAFNKQDKSDLVFQFPKDGKKIYGHRMLLRLLSPYMETMLSGTWAGQNVIEVSEYSYPVYRSYIEYLYTGSLPTLTLPDLIHLYDLANFHLEVELMNECVEIIFQRLSVDNCCKLYEFSVQYSLEDLKCKVIELLTRTT